jgi:RNA polymerase sigma-70 factor (ECF subfamily)
LRTVEFLSIRILRESEEQIAERGRRLAQAEVLAEAQPVDPGNALMLALQRGDSQALQGLFGMYNGRLFNFIYRIVGDSQSAEDILQETWLALYEGRGSYLPSFRFSTWIFTIARRKALSELRRRKVRSIVRSLTFSDDDRQSGQLDLPQCTFDDPESAANGAVVGRLVERALNRLPDAQREIVMLRDVEGFENEEIARILQWNLKPGAIRKRVFDAREAFRRAMIELGYSE